jgi:hypothetical protein
MTYAKPVHGDPGIRSVTPDTALLEPTVLPTLFYHIRTAPTLEHDPLFYKRHLQLYTPRSALERTRSSATDL